MASTTNYSWSTPDDTALVKDGAAAIRSLGSAIDSTVFTNAGAAIAKTIVDAKGDIIAATAADNVSRLAVGANDTVLMADSTAATGLKWGTVSAGGMTLLSTTTLSGASTTISSINQSYKHLLIVMYGVTNATSDGATRIAPNGDTGLCDYVGATSAGISSNSNNRIQLSYSQEMLRTNDQNVGQCMIYNYSNTSFYKTLSWSSGYLDTASARRGAIGGGQYRSTSGVSSLVFANYGGDFSTGTVLLYGVS